MPSVTSIPKRSVSRIIWTNNFCQSSDIQADRPAGDHEIHLEENQLSEAGGLHGFQVGGHLPAIEIAVQEIPVNPGPRGVRRTAKLVFQFAGGQGTAAKRTWKTVIRIFLNMLVSLCWFI